MNTAHSDAAAHAELARKQTLVIRREFSTSLERLWQAWTDPVEIAQWMGRAIVTHCDTLEMDVKAGGRYRIRMHVSDGTTPTVYGNFREVQPMRRLSFTWQWEGKDTAPEAGLCFSI